MFSYGSRFLLRLPAVHHAVPDGIKSLWDGGVFEHLATCLQSETRAF